MDKVIRAMGKLFLPKALLAAGAALAVGTGCVRRDLTVTSDPPGALVFLNDTEAGRTPLTRPFTFYGTYDVRLRKEGYKTLKTKSLVLAPWWQWVPIDLVAELFPVTDHQTKHFVMELDPEAEVAGSTTMPSGPAESADAMLLRALSLRAQLVPLPTSKPAGAATQPATKSEGKPVGATPVVAPEPVAPQPPNPAPQTVPVQPAPVQPSPMQPAPAQPGIIEIPNPK
jgi:hypothetical protein